jgi:hypothetical protein
MTYSILPNLASLKLEIFANRVEISNGQILFFDSQRVKEFKNKIWSYEISTQYVKFSSLKLAKLDKVLYVFN